MKNFNNSPEIEEIRTNISNAFSGLAFDEETHTYTLDGLQLVSTTTYLKRFSEDFNAFFASEAKGKKMLRQNANDKRTGQYYRQRWKYIRDEAAFMGSRVHLFAETAPHFDNPIDWREQAILDFYEWLPEKYEVLFLELRVYDKDTYHAGTLDGLALNTETNKLVIFDWKTNKRNINELYKNKNMKGSFKKLKATPLNKFSIQLSDYANVITKNTGYEFEDRWVIWLRNTPVNTKDSDRNSDYTIKRIKPDVDKPNFKIYKVKDYTKEIASSYNESKEELKKNSKPATVKPGLFAKNKEGSRKTKAKKKGLFAKK
jgi:hypothetical protein